MIRPFTPPLLAAVFAVLMVVVEGAVGVTQESRPSYYWSRASGGAWKVSQRSHFGPLPRVNDVMMEWSSWGPWARCSRSCGGGVNSRSRTCITRFPRVMPGSGVRTSHDHCSGESLEYRVCGAASCPPAQVSALSFRAAQCRHYNNRRVFGRLVNNWVPYMQGGINPCALVCEGEGQGLVYTFGKVTDGTHCSSGSRGGLCVNGRCMPLSCDGRLGGRAREDMCRVCGGNNDTCTHHVGIFHTDLPAADQPHPTPLSSPGPARQNLLLTAARPPKPKTLGYYEVTTIPRGATNVKVSDASPNFLALKAGSKYLLNGNWLIDWPGEVDAGGSSFTYIRHQDEAENLTSLGPTSQDLTLMVLLREHNPGIHYEYWTPNSAVYPVPFTPPPRPPTTTTRAPTTTTTTTTSTTTTTPRPAILTSINTTRILRPSHDRTILERPRNESYQHPSTFKIPSNEANRSSHHSSQRLTDDLDQSSRDDSKSGRIPPGESYTSRSITTTMTTIAPRRHDNESHKTPLTRHKLGKLGRTSGRRRGGERRRGKMRRRGRGGVRDGRRREGLEPSQESNRIRGSGRRKKKRKKKNKKGEKRRILEKEKEEEEKRKILEKEEEEETKILEEKEKEGEEVTKAKKGRERGKGIFRVPGCGSCPKLRRRTKQMFCTSDFVSRVEVLSSEVVQTGEQRYEVLMQQSYKNTVPLLHKEFLWVPDPCQCPRLRPGLTYLVMGTTEVTGGREVRLVLPRHTYVRRFKPQHLARILRVRHNEMRFCRPWRRDLRFLLPPPTADGEQLQGQGPGQDNQIQGQHQERQGQGQNQREERQGQGQRQGQESQGHGQAQEQECERQGERLGQESQGHEHQQESQGYGQRQMSQGQRERQEQESQRHRQRQESQGHGQQDNQGHGQQVSQGQGQDSQRHGQQQESQGHGQRHEIQGQGQESQEHGQRHEIQGQGQESQGHGQRRENEGHGQQENQGHRQQVSQGQEQESQRHGQQQESQGHGQRKESQGHRNEQLQIERVEDHRQAHYYIKGHQQKLYSDRQHHQHQEQEENHMQEHPHHHLRQHRQHHQEQKQENRVQGQQQQHQDHQTTDQNQQLKNENHKIYHHHHPHRHRQKNVNPQHNQQEYYARRQDDYHNRQLIRQQEFNWILTQ